MDIGFMKKESIELIKLTASEGMYLTDGASYGQEVYLGIQDSQDNWREVPEEEYKEFLHRQEEEAQQSRFRERD